MEIPKQSKNDDRQVFRDQNGEPICSIPKGISTSPNSPWYSRLIALLLAGGYQGNLVNPGERFIQAHKTFDYMKVQELTELIESKVYELGIPNFLGVKTPEEIRKKFESYKQLEQFLENLRMEVQK